MDLRHVSLLPCSYERARTEVEKPRLLSMLSAPVLAYGPLDPPTWPAVWGERSYRVALTLAGRLGIGEHTLVMDVVEDGPDAFEIVDHGFSDLISMWEHRLRIERFNGMTRYSDSVRIRAGVLTPLVWLFAWGFYAHRQKRLRRLATGGFDPAVLA